MYFVRPEAKKGKWAENSCTKRNRRTFANAGAVLCLPGTKEIKGLVSGKLDSMINTYRLSVFDAEPALYALANLIGDL